MTCSESYRVHFRRSVIIALTGLAAALLIEAIVSTAAFVTTLIDLFAAAVLFAPAILLGAAMLAPFHLSNLPPRWHLLLSAALGLGILSLLVLAGGCLGLLHRPIWIGVLTVSAVAGLAALSRRLLQHADNKNSGFAWLWVMIVPFVALAFLAAANAPGLIWREEGFGYDILEYHLQLPREYFESGQISYLPHNVYANFPACVEMLYLLSMIVQNNPVDSATTANMLHLGFGVLFVLTVWAVGQDISRVAGAVGAVAAATCTWIEYLSGLAYVENAMLFFGAVAVGVMVRNEKDLEPKTKLGMFALAGLLAGFAGGCKYTAIPMIVAPLALGSLLFSATPKRRLFYATIFCGCALAAMAPWLIKNSLMTGNPLFPLANSCLDANPLGWSAEQTSQWDRGHAANHEPGSAFRQLWSRIPADPEQRFGPAILVLGIFGLLGRTRTRTDVVLVFLLITQAVVWMFATHLYARFAVPLLIPLAVLAARSVMSNSVLRRRAAAVTLIIGAVWNLSFAISRHRRESAPGIHPAIFAEGGVPGYEYLGFVNEVRSKGSKLLLVGDARPFYVRGPVDYFVAFNQNPFLALIAADTPAKVMMDWLRSSGYSHVLVHWSEIRRLEASYGMSPNVPESRISDALHAMKSTGLRHTKSFTRPSGEGGAYVDVFEVLPARINE